MAAEDFSSKACPHPQGICPSMQILNKQYHCQTNFHRHSRHPNCHIDFRL